jgi:hypothetical protein
MNKKMQKEIEEEIEIEIKHVTESRIPELNGLTFTLKLYILAPNARDIYAMGCDD